MDKRRITKEGRDNNRKTAVQEAVEELCRKWFLHQGCHPKGVPGEVIANLSEEIRKLLMQAKSSDFDDQRMEQLMGNPQKTGKGRWGTR